MSVLFIFCLIDVMQNVYESVFHYFLVTQMADRSQTSTGVLVHVYGRLYEVLTLPATVLLAKTCSFNFQENHIHVPTSYFWLQTHFQITSPQCCLTDTSWRDIQSHAAIWFDFWPFMLVVRVT